MGCLLTAVGLVSRVSPVQTALRNCTGDEERPFEVGNQMLISSHRKLPSSKAMVVNVAETVGHDPIRYHLIHERVFEPHGEERRTMQASLRSLRKLGCVRRISNHEARARTQCARAPQDEAESDTAPAEWSNLSGTRSSSWTTA
jgi:hypothetical protein